MKFFARALESVFDRLGDVTVRIRDKAREIDRKVQDSGYIDKLKEAEEKLDEYQNGIAATELKLADKEASVLTMIGAFNALGTAADPLETAADATVAPLNAILQGMNDTYAAINAEIAGFTSIFRLPRFQAMIDVSKSFAGINKSLDIISGPLQAVFKALSPVKPLLDAVGFIYSITVGPVVNWLLDKLGVTRLMDRVADAISGLLPDTRILDGLAANLDGMFGAIDDLLDLDGWTLQIDDLLDDFLDRIFPGIDDTADGIIRTGDGGADTLVGRDGVDDVLDARGGDDLVQGLGGNDLILGTAGNDTIFGGTGNDTLAMAGNLLDHVFIRPENGGPVVFIDLTGAQGSETAHDMEYYQFADVGFTHNQLVNNLFIANPGDASLAGTPGDDLLYARTTAIAIFGGIGDDRLAGSPQSDTLYGGAGDDIIVSGDGADLVYGGDGLDTWQLDVDNRSGNPLTQVDLVTGTSWDGYGRDTLAGIENVTVRDNRDSELFGDAGNNVLTAASGRDLIDGRGGNDVIYGGEGRNILIGGAGADTVYGGNDLDILVAGGIVIPGFGDSYFGGGGTFDTLIYSSDYQGYNVRPENRSSIGPQDPSGSVRIYGAEGRIERLSANGQTVLATDTAVGIERFIGSDLRDTLYGGRVDPGQDVWLDGGDGDDLIITHDARSVAGGAGDDRIVVRSANFAAGMRLGSIDGGGGTDTLDLRQVDLRWSMRLEGSIGTRLEGFLVDEVRELGAEQPVGLNSTLNRLFANMTGIEIAHLGNHDDEVNLMGRERLIVYGGDGDDRLNRLVSNDGSSSATLYGGAGDDSFNFQIEGEGYGGDGDDRFLVIASGDEHRFFGGNGDDVFDVRRMDGALNGGAGFDVIAFRGNPNLVSIMMIDLAAGTVLTPGDINGIEATITGFEHVLGDEVIRDQITGRNVDERLSGRGGNDSIMGNRGADEIYGGSGNDVLEGGSGDDTISGGLGNDIIDGGAGIDTVSYSNATPDGAGGALVAGAFGGVNVNLATNGASGAQGSDQLFSIENVIGSMGADSIVGDNRANVISGGAGDDTLIGGRGNDVLMLGFGTDLADGGSGSDTIAYDTGDATVLGGAGLDMLTFGSLDGRASVDLGTSSFSVTVALQVPVWRDDGTDDLRQFAGVWLTPRDVLETSAAFSNSLDDTTRALPAQGSPAADAFEIDFATVNALHGGVVSSIEMVTGGRRADTITGSGRAETLDGGVGNDRISGEGGNDSLVGDKGNDRLSGGRGNDTINGGTGRDTLSGSVGNDRLIGGADADVLSGGAGADVLIGGAGADLMSGGAGRDRFVLSSVADSGTSAATRDVIDDFISGEDLMVLSAVAPGGSFIGSAAFGNVAGQVRLTASGLLLIDTDGDGIRDMSVQMHGVAALTASDFLF